MSTEKRRGLSAEDAAAVRRRWESRDTRAKLAAEFGVSLSTIDRAIAGMLAFPPDKRPEKRTPREYTRTPAGAEAIAARRQRTIARYTAIFDALAAELGRPPVQAEFAERMGVSRERARQVVNMCGLSPSDGIKIKMARSAARVDAAVSAAVDAMRKEGARILLAPVARRARVDVASCRAAFERLGIEPDSRSMFPDDEVADFRRRLDAGETYDQIAATVGCATMTIWRACNPERHKATVAAREAKKRKQRESGRRWYRNAKERDPEGMHRRNVEAGRRHRQRRHAVEAEAGA